MIVRNLVLCFIIISDVQASSSYKEPKKVGADGQVMTDFANLLKTIVRVNEERVDAIRKIVNLQDYMLTKNQLKFNDYYDSDETSDSVISLEDPIKSRRKENQSYIDERCEQLYRASYGELSEDIKHYCHPLALTICKEYCIEKIKRNCYQAITCNMMAIGKVTGDCRKFCENQLPNTDQKLVYT